MLQQRAVKPQGGVKSDVIYSGTGLGYDAAGNVVGYLFKNYEGTNYTNKTTITLGQFESYVELNRHTTSDLYRTGDSASKYDANGYLVGIDDSTENTLDRTIVNDAAGRALRVTQFGNDLYTHIVNGEILGRYGVGPDEVDPRTDKGVARFAQLSEFDFGYRPISGSHPAPGVGSYTVRQGEGERRLGSV